MGSIVPFKAFFGRTFLYAIPGWDRLGHTNNPGPNSGIGASGAWFPPKPLSVVPLNQAISSYIPSVECAPSEIQVFAGPEWLSLYYSGLNWPVKGRRGASRARKGENPSRVRLYRCGTQVGGVSRRQQIGLQPASASWIRSKSLLIIAIVGTSNIGSICLYVISGARCEAG